MNLTIIRDDNMVYVDGRSIEVDCSSLPDDVRAVQWNGTTGHIEFDSDPPRMPETITSVDAYQSIINAWNVRRDEIDAPPPPVPLAELKASIKTRIDADAERARLKHMTLGAGMAMTYIEKHAQARAIIDLGEAAANALSEAQRDNQFPTLAASIGIEAATLWGCAELVIQRYEAFADLSALIERARLQGKKNVSDASDAAGVLAAYEAIAWP